MEKNIIDELKEILDVPHIRGTPEQIRSLALRVAELCEINGRVWVTANASQLLIQWDVALDWAATEAALK